MICVFACCVTAHAFYVCSKSFTELKDPFQLLPALVLSLATSPLSLASATLQSRLQVGLHANLRDCLRYIRAQHGKRGYFAGFMPFSCFFSFSLLSQPVLAIAQNVMYSSVNQGQDPNLATKAVFEFNAGVLSAMAFSPFHLMGIRMATQTSSTDDPAFLSTMRKAWKSVKGSSITTPLNIQDNLIKTESSSTSLSPPSASSTWKSFWRGSTRLGVASGLIHVITLLVDPELKDFSVQ